MSENGEKVGRPMVMRVPSLPIVLGVGTLILTAISAGGAAIGSWVASDRTQQQTVGDLISANKMQDQRIEANAKEFQQRLDTLRAIYDLRIEDLARQAVQERAELRQSMARISDDLGTLTKEFTRVAERQLQQQQAPLTGRR